jgi:hypothetical protein
MLGVRTSLPETRRGDCCDGRGHHFCDAFRHAINSAGISEGPDMKVRRTLEDYERVKKAKQAHTTPGDVERKRRVLASGLDSLRRLHGDQTWEDWMCVGEALLVVTDDTLAALKLAAWNPGDKQLATAFEKTWTIYEREAGDNHKPLTKQERRALREVMTNPEITAWRVGIDAKRKRRLNHPNAVINSWRTATKPKPPKTAALTAEQHTDGLVALLRGKPRDDQISAVSKLASKLGLKTRDWVETERRNCALLASCAGWPIRQ